MNIKKLKKFRAKAIEKYRIAIFENGFIVTGRYGWEYTGACPTALNSNEVVLDLTTYRRKYILNLCRNERLERIAKKLNKLK